METKVKVVVGIEIGDKKLLLTEEQAKELYAKLKEMYEVKSPQFIPYPVYPSYPVYLTYPRWEWIPCNGPSYISSTSNTSKGREFDFTQMSQTTGGVSSNYYQLTS